jgi:outer membrane protein OmpA-like peptidoglycan-associated protein
MKKLNVLIAIIFLFELALPAQEQIPVSRKDFRTGQPGFEAAWKHIKDGDTFYDRGGIWYARAFDEYRLGYNYNRLNAALNYKMGVSALFSDKKKEAAAFLGKAYGLDSEIAGDILLLWGRSLLYNGKFSEAEAKLRSYMELLGNKKSPVKDFVNRLLDECLNMAELTKDTVRIELKNPGGNVNSNSDDYSVVLTADGNKMFYASRRPAKVNQKSKYSDTKYDENIYVTENKNGNWSVALEASRNLNTEFCEKPVFLDRTGAILYIYQGYEGNGDIMYSEFKKGEWKKPKPETFGVNGTGTETSLAISPKDDEIAFVSDRGKKGFGGKDIYFIRWSGRKWHKPVNAGAGINTPLDEESVAYSRGGDTLWFSSRGHNTLGGFDIYYCVRNGDSGFSAAINAGYPLNTAYNDMYYVPSPVLDSAFFLSSDRDGGMGGLDIYSGRYLPKPVVKQIPIPDLKPAPPVIPVKTDTVLPPVQVRDTVRIVDTVHIVKEVQVPVVKPVNTVHDTVLVRDTVVVVKEVPAAPVIQVKEKELFISGKITDSEKGEPVLARIDIIDPDGGGVVGTTASSDADGSYRVKLTGKKDYTLDIRATGYLSDTRKIKIPDSFKGEIYYLDFSLSKAKVGKKVVMKNIFFQSGKSVLAPASSEELDKLVKLLEDNPEMRIEISGHTDNTGNPVVNAKLSTERARAVVDFIAGKGIDRTRLTYIGYGSDQPVADNKTESGRAMNRRVEFKILGF